MSERIQSDAFVYQAPDISLQSTWLPGWLADRLLRDGEKCARVFGPRYNPSWERYVTHPALFLAALAIGAVCFGIGWLTVGPEETLLLFVLPGAILALASIFVLGLSNGYFTRLVVTNFRLVVLQGYEVCRAWDLDHLPRSLIRFGPKGEKGKDRAIDLEAVKTLLGGSSDKFAEAKSILAFGKQLEQIKARENDRS
jgi:hypothetical protein